MPPRSIRPATRQDAAAIAAIRVASWRAAYAHILPAAFLHALDSAAMQERWRERAQDADPQSIVLVAAEKDHVLGFVWAGRARNDEQAPDAAEVYAIYVAPQATKRGTGTLLLQHAEQRLRAAGFTRVSLWVFARNHRAHRFYRSAGWSADGSRKTWTRDGVRRVLVRFRKDLA